MAQTKADGQAAAKKAAANARAQPDEGEVVGPAARRPPLCVRARRPLKAENRRRPRRRSGSLNGGHGGQAARARRAAPSRESPATWR